MNIGIITFHWAPNCGAVLQAYALQTYLQTSGHSVEIIDYRPPYKKWGLRTYISKSLRTTLSKWRELYRLKKFRKPYLQGLRLTDATYWKPEPLKKSCPPYDLLIAGSDQIWNPAMFQSARFNSLYFGSFAPKRMTKISYAASLGQGRLTHEERKELQQFLSGFTAVGVREENAVPLLSSLVLPGCPVRQVADPVFLLQPKDYRSFMDVRSAGGAPFLCTYLLSPPSTDHVRIIRQAAASLRLPLTSLRNPDTGYGLPGARNKILPPSQWLGHMHQAEWIICSSFHAVAFALLFHKPFIYLETEDYRKQGGNQRVLSLLKPLHLEHRCLCRHDEALMERILKEPIDWNFADAVLEQKRTSSQHFLNQFLS